MTIAEGEMSIDPVLKGQIWGIEIAKRVVKFVHNYVDICVGFWEEMKCHFLKTVNTSFNDTNH